MADKQYGSELADAFSAAGTDKHVSHHYEKIYTWLLESYRRSPCRLLEIGVLEGASLQAWEAYLPQAEILGIDKCAVLRGRLKRSEVLIGNVCDSAFLATVVSRGPFDVMIDDGSHLNVEQQTAFECLWPCVADGGLYIIEDLQVAELPAYKCEAAPSTSEWCYSRLEAERLVQNGASCWTVFAGELVAFRKIPR